MTMTDTDILRATRSLRAILDRRYSDAVWPPKEMSGLDKESRSVTEKMHIQHLKYELEKIPQFLEIGAQSKREKAFRWLSDVGGVMRSELGLISIAELSRLFRPEADQLSDTRQFALSI